MTNKHTPGPWLEFDPGHIRDQSLQLVAVVQHGINAKANARLISAAPELLSFVQEFLSDYNSEDGLYSLKHYAKKAHELVAKATGEQA